MSVAVVVLEVTARVGGDGDSARRWRWLWCECGGGDGARRWRCWLWCECGGSCGAGVAVAVVWACGGRCDAAVAVVVVQVWWWLWCGPGGGGSGGGLTLTPCHHILKLHPLISAVTTQVRRMIAAVIGGDIDIVARGASVEAERLAASSAMPSLTM